MKDLIKRYWDIFGGVITSLFISLITRWKLDSIQLISSEIVLTLLCMGLFKVIKLRIDEKNLRKKLALDKVVDNQRPIRAIKLAENPTKTGEELAKVLIDTMKGGKKLMKKIKNLFVWIRKYWQQLLGFISVVGEYALYVYAIVNDKLGFILNHLPEGAGWQIAGKIGIGVLVTLVVVLQIRNMAKWCGVGTIEQATKYIESKKEQAKEKLSPNAKENIKKALKEYKAKLKEVVKHINDVKGKIEEFNGKISSMKELLQLGLGDNGQYHELISNRDRLKSELAQVEVEETHLNQEIAKYKQVL